MKIIRTAKECKEHLIELSRPEISEEELETMIFDRSLYAYAMEIGEIRNFLYGDDKEDGTNRF